MQSSCKVHPLTENARLKDIGVLASTRISPIFRPQRVLDIKISRTTVLVQGSSYLLFQRHPQLDDYDRLVDGDDLPELPEADK